MAPPTHGEITPAEDTPWATDVWQPGSAVDASWPLALSEDGDVLIRYSDDPSSWEDGVDDGETGLAIVSPNGDIEYLEAPGEGTLADDVLFAKLNESTIALVNDSESADNPDTAMWLVDRDTGVVTPIPSVVPDGALEGERVLPGPDFTLIDDTVLWAFLGVFAADSNGRVWNPWGASPNVFSFKRNDCEGESVVSAVSRSWSEEAPITEVTYTEATLDDHGMLQVDPDSVFILDQERDGAAPLHGVTRCGDSILGAAWGSMGDEGAEYLMATVETATLEPTGISAEGVPIASFLTEKWIAVAASGPLLRSRTSIVNRSTGEQWNPGGDSMCGGLLEVSGRTIMWAEPAEDWSDEFPPMGQCITYVGTLRTD